MTEFEDDIDRLISHLRPSHFCHSTEKVEWAKREILDRNWLKASKTAVRKIAQALEDLLRTLFRQHQTFKMSYHKKQTTLAHNILLFKQAFEHIARYSLELSRTLKYLFSQISIEQSVEESPIENINALLELTNKYIHPCIGCCQKIMLNYCLKLQTSQYEIVCVNERDCNDDYLARLVCALLNNSGGGFILAGEGVQPGKKIIKAGFTVNQAMINKWKSGIDILVSKIRPQLDHHNNELFKYEFVETVNGSEGASNHYVLRIKVLSDHPRQLYYISRRHQKQNEVFSSFEFDEKNQLTLIKENLLYERMLSVFKANRKPIKLHLEEYKDSNQCRKLEDKMNVSDQSDYHKFQQSEVFELNKANEKILRNQMAIMRQNCEILVKKMQLSSNQANMPVNLFQNCILVLTEKGSQQIQFLKTELQLLKYPHIMHLAFPSIQQFYPNSKTQIHLLYFMRKPHLLLSIKKNVLSKKIKNGLSIEFLNATSKKLKVLHAMQKSVYSTIMESIYHLFEKWEIPQQKQKGMSSEGHQLMNIEFDFSVSHKPVMLYYLYIVLFYGSYRPHLQQITE